MDILIIKLGAKGDVLRTTSILAPLKNEYPNSKISWITGKDSLGLIKGKGFIDRALPYNKDNLLRLKRESFDLVISLDEDINACSLASSLKKKNLIGFYLGKDKKIKPTETAKDWYDMSILGENPRNNMLKKKNKLTYQQHMFKILGIKPKDHAISMRLSKEQRRIVKNFKRRNNISNSDLVIGLNTGSSKRWPLKQLPVKKVALLAERISKEIGAKIILFGGPEEIERNNRIMSLTKVPIINSGCGNNLKEFPSLVSICHVLVTSDSFGLHMGIALKRKIVVFFGPTSPTEIELYNLGVKVLPKKGCLCCYRTDKEGKNNCINYISVNDLFKAIKKTVPKNSVSIIITSFKEKNLDLTMQSILKQKLKHKDKIIIVSPDKEAKILAKKNKQVMHFKDPGKGKSYALNLIIPKIKEDILILTDGDVILGEKSIEKIKDRFKDPSLGCLSGRPVSQNSKKTRMGYWSHLLYDAGAHRIREELSKQDKFLECSGYLFAFRNKLIKEIPLNVAEDTIIPYFFYQRGYKIGYEKKAKVYVKNPTNLRDWINQRKRTAKAHKTLNEYVDTKYIPRVKSFKNEVKKGFFWALAYPRGLTEFIWTFELILARLYVWLSLFVDIKFRKKTYTDDWNRIESTK